jgi:hypothetical protein
LALIDKAPTPPALEAGRAKEKLGYPAIAGRAPKPGPRRPEMTRGPDDWDILLDSFWFIGIGSSDPTAENGHARLNSNVDAAARLAADGP